MITIHAVEQYVARVKPAFTAEQAREEIERLIVGVRPQDEPPAWSRPDPAHVGQSYLTVSDGITFVVAANNSVITVLVRGGRSEETKRNRKAAKRAERAKRRWRNGLTAQGAHRRGAQSEW